jgi:hypothetical protein
LPSPYGELACIIVADLDTGDPTVPPMRVVVSHFGNTEDAEDRRLQSLALADLVRQTREQNAAQPLLVLSYLTTLVSGPNFKVIMDSGLIDPQAVGWGKFLNNSLYPHQERYWEYILHNDALYVPEKSIVAITSSLSDTDLQVCTAIVKKKR